MTTERTDRPPLGLPPLSRRGFLGGVTAASAAALLAQLGTAAPSFATSEGTVLPLVEPLPDGAPDRTLFAENEQVFAAYLMILSPLANSVVDDDEDLFGWMEDGWQRLPNQPFNARIMEHVATLSWFYSHERTWNPYYLDPNLLGRLDAALGYYLSLQHDDGSYPEYSPTEHHLSPTGFGTVAQSAVLRDLLSVDALPERRGEIETALRASSAWLVDLDRPHWNLPVRFVNQVVAGLAGVAQAATVMNDAAMAASLSDRMAALLEHGQAPAGFFNEPLTPDAGYNFTVMLPDVGHIYEQTQDPSAVELARRFAEWFGYIVVMEPGQPQGFVMSATSARGVLPTFTTTPEDDLDRSALGRALLEQVPALGAFYATAEEKQAGRAAWALDPEPVQPREKQDSSARLYMHVPVAPDGVSTAERDARVADLPYLREDAFTQLRRGTLDQQYAFVRRPGCYTAAAYGVRPYASQRMGTNAFWHPEAGMFVLSLNTSGPDDWTTVDDVAGTATSRSEVTAAHHAGDDISGAAITADDLTGFAGVFTTRYTTADAAVTTDVSHWQDGLRRSMATTGASRERIPLIIGPQDEVAFLDGTPAPYDEQTITVASGLTVTRGDVRLVISWGEEWEATYAPTSTSFLGGTRSQRILTVSFVGELTTELTAVDLAEVAGERVAFGVTSHTVERDGAHHTALHVINLDQEPVDIRVVSASGRETFRGLAPGASGYRLFRNERRLPAPGVAVATTRGSGRVRAATRRFEV